MTRRREYGTVRKLPSGRWQARRWELGQQVAAPVTFTTKADANGWLREVATDVARGEWVDPRKGTVAFGVYGREWLEQKAGLRSRTREGTVASGIGWCARWRSWPSVQIAWASSSNAAATRSCSLRAWTPIS